VVAGLAPELKKMMQSVLGNTELMLASGSPARSTMLTLATRRAARSRFARSDNGGCRFHLALPVTAVDADAATAHERSMAAWTT